MAAEGESLSDSQSEVSNTSDELTSSESSISDSDSDSNNNNDIRNGSQSAGKRKDLPNRPSASHDREQQKKRKKPTKKTADKGITLLEMEELSLWVFSSEEAKKVESTIRQRLLDSPRLRAFEGRRKFALHLISEEQKDNFELLIIGFCRTFATSCNRLLTVNDK